MQPIYDAPVSTWAGLEAADCDWPDRLPHTGRHTGRHERLMRALEDRWRRWHKAKKIIDDDWRQDAERRLAEVAGELDRDRQKAVVEKLEAEEAARLAEDEKAVTAMLDQLAALIRKRKDDWKVQAANRLNSEICKTERQVLLARGIVRGRRCKA